LGLYVKLILQEVLGRVNGILSDDMIWTTQKPPLPTVLLFPMPESIIGLPCSWGNKYRNLDLLVGGVSKIETINYAHESRGVQI
jgi:hypothetical protein